MARGPAYRLETERLVLRCFEPADAFALDRAIAISVDHLKPWLEFAHHEPKPVDDRVSLLRRFRADFDVDREYVYGVFSPDESELLGVAGSHTRQGPGVREIGYWVRADRIRRGVASEASAALTKAAFEVDEVGRVEIRCDVGNTASSAIPRKLGFSYEGILRQQNPFLDARRDVEVWSLVRSEYQDNRIQDLPIAAYGATGNVLIE